MTISVIKVLFPATVSFFMGILLTPLLTHYLYKFKMWKKQSVKLTVDGLPAIISQQLHNDEERKTPRMGGIVIWGSALITILGLYFASKLFPDTFFDKLSFLSRNQTWLPLCTLVMGGLVGFIDDYLDCRENGTYVGGGLSLTIRLSFVSLLGLVCALWFYIKLGYHTVDIPFYGFIDLGLLFIPFVILTIIAIYSGGIIDGVDGLSGGVFLSIYAAYAIISLNNGQVDLAAFCSVVAGGILAFLWFNIPPARFFNSETGTMALTTAIVVVAFLTKEVAALPIVCALLLITSASSIIQILSKKFRNGKKVFLVAPLHNHFQAKGWPPYKVTMRYWVISMVCALLGVVVALVG